VGDDVDVDVTGFGNDDLSDAGAEQGRDPAAPTRADQDL